MATTDTTTDDVEAAIRMAISDPGKYVSRGCEDRGEGTVYESVSSWAARAVAAALAERRDGERDQLECMIREQVVKAIQAPRAMTNAEMTALRELDEDVYHEGCGDVYASYFARIARGKAAN